MPKSSPSKAVWGSRNVIIGMVYYAFVPDEKAWDRELRRLGVSSEPYPDAAARTTIFDRRGTDEKLPPDEKKVALVTLHSKYDDNLVVAASLLAHEAVHIKQEMMACMGEETPSIEFEAYVLQRIFMELFAAYLETRKKNETCTSTPQETVTASAS